MVIDENLLDVSNTSSCTIISYVDRRPPAISSEMRYNQTGR